uniref:F-box domain-containing protein n=1 Tax=Oryza barthii TaxID=65489 RepID=A0A0D3FUX1_9ORYZ
MAVRPRRRRRRSALPRAAASRGEGDDRLSVLPDELLLIVMRGLDTRSARRRRAVPPLGAPPTRAPGARLPRQRRAPAGLPPARAAEFLALLGGRWDDAAGRKLDASLARYERRVMRGLAEPITGFLDAGVLRVEFFATNDAHHIGCVHRLINTAVGLWGVEELEVAIKPAPWRRRKVWYFFFLQPVVGADMPEDFPHLKKLHLKNCHSRDLALVVDAPQSSSSAAAPPITELVVERCSFLGIQLNHAALRWKTWRASTTPTRDVPRLRRVHLSFFLDSGIVVDAAQHPLPGPDKYKLDWHVSERMASLVVRFTGPERWILPWRVSTRLRSLRRLLVADVPPDLGRLVAAPPPAGRPSLESLHVHVATATQTADDQPAAAAPGREIMWPPVTFWHRKLGELVVAGFEWTPGQVAFVRYVVKACKALRQVELLRHGEVRYNGLWEWEVVRQRECGGGERRHWSRMEEIGIKRQILSGRSWFREDVEALLLFFHSEINFLLVQI